MSTSVLPTLIGLAYPVTRSTVWDTNTQEVISGKETRIAYQTYPRYKWEATYNVLRSASAYTEFQNLLGFYNARQGGFDTFLYQDPDDYTVSSQSIATGDGSTTAFQLLRTLGGFSEPILAPNTGGTINIYLAGVKQTTGYTVSGWGTTTPGVVTFTSAPGSGVAITADFAYYWPCRFDQDNVAFELFVNGYYSVKKIAWKSVKN